jgi:hypothetical protein
MFWGASGQSCAGRGMSQHATCRPERHERRQLGIENSERHILSTTAFPARPGRLIGRWQKGSACPPNTLDDGRQFCLARQLAAPACKQCST